VLNRNTFLVCEVGNKKAVNYMLLFVILSYESASCVFNTVCCKKNTWAKSSLCKNSGSSVYKE
jgi:hypothetical protein